MAEILQKAYQKAIDEQGEMEDKKSQKAPTIDSIIGTGPDIIQLPKTEVKEVVSDEGADAQEASAAKANVPESEQRTSPVITTAAELNTSNPTKPTENDDENDVTSTVEDPEVTVATISDSIPTVMVTNNDGRTPRELNQKLIQPVENDATADASAAEAKATNDNDGTVSQREVSQPPSVDQMVLDLKRKIAVAAESKSSDVIGCYSPNVGRRKQVISWFSRRVSRRKQVIGCYGSRFGRRKQVIGWDSRRVGRRKQVIGWYSRRVGGTCHCLSFCFVCDVAQSRSGSG
jgi:hypothetical protein